MKLDLIINNAIDAKNISGVHNSNIKAIEDYFKTEIGLNGSIINISTDDEYTKGMLESVFRIMLRMSELSLKITARDVMYIISIAETNRESAYIDFLNSRKPLCHTLHNKPIYAKTLKQDEYLKCIQKKDLIFSIGAAGTGKTYLAVCYAVSELKKGNIEKIILTRPAVEAGESLGFLPGDLKEKVDPYLRPLYDALYDMLGVENVTSLIEKQIIYAYLYNYQLHYLFFSFYEVNFCLGWNIIFIPKRLPLYFFNDIIYSFRGLVNLEADLYEGDGEHDNNKKLNISNLKIKDLKKASNKENYAIIFIDPFASTKDQLLFNHIHLGKVEGNQ